ncbi:competence protein ComGC [Brassicibacter mesophilus]
MTKLIFNIIIVINIANLKTMKRRVDMEGSLSELVIVQDQYEIYIEEHLGVSNRNQFESRLRRSHTVK